MRPLPLHFWHMAYVFISQASLLVQLAALLIVVIVLYAALLCVPKRYVAVLYAKEGDGRRTQLWSDYYRFHFSASLALHKHLSFCNSLGCSYSQFPLETNIHRIGSPYIPLAA